MNLLLLPSGSIATVANRAVSESMLTRLGNLWRNKKMGVFCYGMQFQGNPDTKSQEHRQFTDLD